MEARSSLLEALYDVPEARGKRFEGANPLASPLLPRAEARSSLLKALYDVPEARGKRFEGANPLASPLLPRV